MKIESGIELELGMLKTERKVGEEVFCYGKEAVAGEKLLNFWRWMGSDLVSNATRGILAEYIVAMALGLHKGVRGVWDAFDLRTEEGIKVEVKSAAYVQSWGQKEYSQIRFGIKATHGWSMETNEFEKQRRRQADVYVFALLAHREKATINPMNLEQWIFYVLATKRLDADMPRDETISLKRLKTLGPKECGFGGLKESIKASVI